MSAYYNELDPFAAQWLRNLIAAGHIAPGDVDERSIVNVRADDLRGYTQCHFFAGIGGWSLALRLAGWDDARSVWTGSCPCQPFSAAGRGKAADDERHLWPAWASLIRECRPPVVLGEQVEAAIGWGWLDVVFADLEAEGYACGASVLPACGVGAPHIRNRVWWVADCDDAGHQAIQREGVTRTHSNGKNGRPRTGLECGDTDGGLADADGRHASAEGLQRGGQHRQQPQDSGIGLLADAEGRGDIGQRPKGPFSERLDHSEADGLADALPTGWAERWPFTGDGQTAGSGEPRTAGALAHPGSVGPSQLSGRREQSARSSPANFWGSLVWLPCRDGKVRPTQPGLQPLAHGATARVGRLRAYGNAIVAPLAAEFIAAFMECQP